MMSATTKSMVWVLFYATTILNVHAQCDESGSGSGDSGSGDSGSGCDGAISPTTPSISPTVSPTGSYPTVSPTTTSPTASLPTISPTFTFSPTVSPTVATVIEILFDGNLGDLSTDEKEEIKEIILAQLLEAFPGLVVSEFVRIELVQASIKAIVTFLPGSGAADPGAAQNISDTLSYETPLLITLANNKTFAQIPVTTTTAPTPSPTTPAPTVMPTSSPTVRPPSSSKTLSDGAVAAIVICVLVIAVLIIVAVVSLSKKDTLPKYSHSSSVKPLPDNHIGKSNQGYSTVSMTLADKDTVRITSI
eukprot:m.199456 g.199456  ORF g.199456 m.199456 type:complete len:305 (-) comp32735_c0_seq1:624-1538(-)